MTAPADDRSAAPSTSGTGPHSTAPEEGTDGTTDADATSIDSPIRIGVVVYGSLDAHTGSHLYDRKLVEYLESVGDEVDVVSIPERSYGRSVATNLSAKLPRRLERCDVVLQDELCHPSLPLVNRRVTKTPVVAIVHHLSSDDPRNWWRSQLVRRLERRYLASVDGYVFNSRATRDSVGRLVDADPSVLAPPGGDRFETVGAGAASNAARGSPDDGPEGTPEDGPESGHVRTAAIDANGVDANGVDANAIRERATEEPFRVATAAASVTPRKGITTLVDALDRVPGAWRLTVAGDLTTDPDYVDRVRALAEKRGVEDRITLAGRLPDAAVAAMLAESHVFALPSRYEAFGIGYLEGMGFGLPAIAAARGGARDVVDHGVTGYLVPPDDPGAVTDAIAPLASDRARLARMGGAALDRYRAHPTWAETGARVREFLHSFV